MEGNEDLAEIRYRKYQQHYATARETELRANPIKGNYDQAHLKEIHAHLFQDEKKYVPPERILYHAGRFRNETTMWAREREIEGISPNPSAPKELVEALFKDGVYKSVTLYSRMSEQDKENLNSTLSQIKPGEIKAMNAKEAGEYFGKLYGDLDYIHPFQDGNSRTLRTFIGQLAQETGFKIDWAKIANSEHSKNQLYAARDQSIRKHFMNDANQIKQYPLMPFVQNLLEHIPSLSKQISSITEKISILKKQDYQAEFKVAHKEVKEKLAEQAASEKKNKNNTLKH